MLEYHGISMCVPRIPGMPWFFTWRHWMTGLIFDRSNPNLQKIWKGSCYLMFHLSLCHDAIQVNYMKSPYKFKSPTVSEVYVRHLQNPCAPHRFPRISRVEANINRPGNFNRRHDHGTGTASFLASGLESWSCGILEVEVNDDLTIFDLFCFACHMKNVIYFDIRLYTVYISIYMYIHTSIYIYKIIT